MNAAPRNITPPTWRFLAFTKKFGWIVVETAARGWTGYWTVPGKYTLSDEMILRRAPLPRNEDVTNG